MSIYFTILGSLGSLLVVLYLLFLYKEHRHFLLILSLISFVINRLVPYRNFFDKPSLEYSFTEDLFPYFYIQDMTWFVFAFCLFVFHLRLARRLG